MQDFNGFYGFDTRPPDSVQGHSVSGVHVITTDQIGVVIGSTNKYGEPSTNYVTIDLKKYGFKVTSGEVGYAEVVQLRKPKTQEFQLFVERYGHIDWFALALKWLIEWTKDEPSRFILTFDAIFESGREAGLAEKTDEWANWFRDGFARANYRRE